MRKYAIAKKDYEMLASFRYSLRQFLRFSEEAALAAGITPQQHQALLAIKGFPGRDFVTIGELAERLQIQHHSAVGMANRLVSERLAKRQQSKEDRRQVYLSLTANGEEILRQLSTAHKKQLQFLEPEMSQIFKRFRKRGRTEFTE